MMQGLRRWGSTMKKLILVLIAVAAIAVAFFGWRMMTMTPPESLDLARSKPTISGLFVAAIAPENEPVAQGALHAWILTVTTPDGAPVEDAEIAVDGGMPQHGHGLPTAPAMTQRLGEGRYRIEGVRFNMSGWWELSFTVTAGGASDRVTFNVVL
jgi:hypothetical protein